MSIPSSALSKSTMGSWVCANYRLLSQRKWVSSAWRYPDLPWEAEGVWPAGNLGLLHIQHMFTYADMQMRGIAQWIELDSNLKTMLSSPQFLYPPMSTLVQTVVSDPPFVCTACIQICAHVKDPILVCRKRAGLTARGMEAWKYCIH